MSEPTDGNSSVVIDLSQRIQASRSALGLKRREIGGCSHQGVTYVVSPGERDVTCGRCNAPLNPIWVLEQLARTESRLNELLEVYADAKREHEKRTRCKCQHCGRMTRIRGV